MNPLLEGLLGIAVLALVAAPVVLILLKAAGGLQGGGPCDVSEIDYVPPDSDEKFWESY